jgi:hypothetical protein
VRDIPDVAMSEQKTRAYDVKVGHMRIAEMPPWHLWLPRNSGALTDEEIEAGKRGELSAERIKELANVMAVTKQRLFELNVHFDEWHPTWGIN